MKSSNTKPASSYISPATGITPWPGAAGDEDISRSSGITPCLGTQGNEDVSRRSGVAPCPGAAGDEDTVNSSRRIYFFVLVPTPSALGAWALIYRGVALFYFTSLSWRIVDSIFAQSPPEHIVQWWLRLATRGRRVASLTPVMSGCLFSTASTLFFFL